MKTTLKQNGIILLQWLAATFILLHPALWNRFPLLNSDTGTYLTMAHTLLAAADRPVFYGLFVKYTGIEGSLWSVIIIQNFLLALTLWCFLRNFMKPFSSFSYLLIIMVLTYTTGMSWFSCQLMTDVFTPLLILSFFILLFGNENIFGKIFFTLLFILSAVVHYSNLMLIVILFFALLKVQFILYPKLKMFSGKTILLFSVLLIATCFVTPVKNYFAEGKFYYSHYNGIMMAGKLSETGLLKRFLDEACPTHNYAICKFKDQLSPTQPGFLYTEQSVLDSMGDWNKNEEELSVVSRKAILWHPFLFIGSSLECAATNLLRLDVGTGLHYYEPGTSVHNQMLYSYSDQFNRFSTSRQQFSQLNFDWERMIQRIVILLSLAFILIVLLVKNFRQQIPSTTKYFMLVIIFSFIINALITGTLASAHDDRYQSRLAWLACLPVLFYLAPVMERKIFSAIEKLLKRN